MASIRLFGRGKSSSAAASGPRAGSGPAVDAEMIAAALADLSTAAVSATWRCRHASGMSIGEGAVDFGAHRSRATVIRGKRTYEYVRNGSSVYRALLPEEGELAAAQAEPELEEEDEEADDLEESAATLDEDGDDEEEAEEGPEAGEDEGEPEASDSSDEDDDDEPDEESDEPEQLDAEKEPDPRDWQTFSEHDACGVHAYAEPTVLAQAVRRAGVVQARKAEEIDGVMLSAFTVTAKPKPADPDKLLARLARQLRDHGANTVVVTAFVAEDGAGEEDISEVGISEDGDIAAGSDDTAAKPRIVRLRLELPHWTPADDPTADHSVSVDLFELGDPVEIELPDRDRATRRTSRTCADLSLF